MLYFGIPRHTQWDQIWLWLSISSNNGSKLHYGNVDGVYYYINTTLNSHVQHTLLNSWVSLVRLLRVSTNFFSSSSTRLLSSCFSSAHTALCWARTWNKIIKEQYNKHAYNFAGKCMFICFVMVIDGSLTWGFGCWVLGLGVWLAGCKQARLLQIYL